MRSARDEEITAGGIKVEIIPATLTTER